MAEGETQGTAIGAAGALLGEWMSREELAAEIGISADTLQKWQSRRIGPPVTRIGRKVLYRRDSVRAWMIEQEQKPRTAARR
jgi:predicted site-specific integrase-resolvase